MQKKVKKRKVRLLLMERKRAHEETETVQNVRGGDSRRRQQVWV